MARRVAKSKKTKKAASPAKKAGKARAPKKVAKAKKSASKSTAKKPKRSAAKKAIPKKAAPKKAASKKARPKKAASKKVASKKKALPKPAKPRAKASKPVKKTVKKAVKPAVKKSVKKAAKPAKKSTKPVIKRSVKKATKPTTKRSAKATQPAAKKAKQTKTQRAVKPARILPRPKPRAKSKPSPAELEALRVAKELRQAQARQLGHYDKAIRAFNSRRFQTAHTLFEKVAAGPDSTFGDRARIHIQICQRQTQTRKVKLKTADEHYNYGIQLINERRFEEASRRIAQALKMQPRAAHVHFAAAVVGALTQDIESTAKSLKKAIDLDPHNRVLALNDADLASVADEPAIAKLLHGDR